MHTTEAHLSPDDRRREIASILARGILRLQSRREACNGALSAPPEKSPKTSQKALESLPPVRTDVVVS